MIRTLILTYLVLFISIPSESYSGNNKLDVIFIDAGHGGKDPGTTGLNGTKEKDINLAIALKLGDLIKKRFPEMKIIYSRTKDVYSEVRERTAMANSSKAKLYISIHCNHKKEEESDKNGFEIYLLDRERTPEAMAITLKDNSLIKYQQAVKDTTSLFIFSSLVQNGYLKLGENLSSHLEISILNNTQLASRGVMQAGFWVLVGASMPSVLVECGYLSDENDEKYLSSEDGQNAFGKALLEGFSKYKLFYEMN